MTVEIQTLTDGDTLETIGRVRGGRIISGKQELRSLIIGDVPSEDALLERFRGPTVFARRVDGVEAAGSGPFADVPVIPDGTKELNQDALALWVGWVRRNRPETLSEAEARKFNPELHPRGPDGKFVERPWDIPGDLEIDNIRTTPTVDLLEELQNAGEPIDQVLASSDVKIDGIPDDVNSVSQAKERLGGDGIVFQDLEPGDKVQIINDGSELGKVSKGRVQKTEQVDGKPNRATLLTDKGNLKEVDVHEGSTITRSGGPTLPPTAVMGDDPLSPGDVSKGDRISVVTGMEGSAKPTVAGTGTVDSLSENGDMLAATVDGDDYDLKHPNVQAFDASPEELAYDDVAEGDTVAAFTGDMKMAEGEVVGKTQVGDNDYLTVNDEVTGDDVQINADDTTLTAPGAVASTGADEAAKEAVESPPDLETASPADVNAADLNWFEAENVGMQDVEPGDWVGYKPPGGTKKVGKINDIGGNGKNALIKHDEGGLGDGIDEVPIHALEDIVRFKSADSGGESGDNLDVDPADVDPDDLSITDLEKRATEDFSPGDWAYIAPDGDGGPYVGPVQDSDLNSIHVETEDGLMNWVDTQVAQRYIPPEMVNEAADAGPSFETPPEDIDPGSVSAQSIPFEKTDPDFDPMASQEDDWVVYADGTSSHAGKVVQASPDQIDIETGHYSDPQYVDPDDVEAKIDPSAVVEAGDPAGVDETKTSEPADHDDFDLPDVSDVADTPNPPEELSPEDLNHPVSPPDDPGHGMLSEDHANALTDAAQAEGFGGWDLMEAAKTDDTGKRPGHMSMSYPQAKGPQVMDQIAEFVDRVDGIPSQKANTEMQGLLNDIHDWKGSSYSDQSQAVEKAFHSGLRLPGPFRNSGLDGKEPTKTRAALASALSKISQEWIDQHFDDIDTVDHFGTESADDELPLYRGVASPAVGSLLRDWAEDPAADEVNIQSSKMGNFTTDPTLADSWSTRDVVIKQNATVDDVVMSPDMITSGETGIDDEGEIWLTGGVHKEAKENIQIRKASKTESGDPMTLADLPDNVEDMDDSHLGTIKAFAKKLRNKAQDPGNETAKYVLHTESQIDTLRDVADKMEASSEYSNIDVSEVEKLVELSEKHLDETPAGPNEAVA